MTVVLIIIVALFLASCIKYANNRIDALEKIVMDHAIKLGAEVIVKEGGSE